MELIHQELLSGLGFISPQCLELLQESYSEEEIVIFFAINECHKSPIEVSQKLNLPLNEVIEVYLDVKRFADPAPDYSFHSNRLGWADSTRFRN